MRQIENHLESIIQGIVNRCRGASAARNHVRKVNTTLEHAQSAYELALSGYLIAEDAKALVVQAIKNIQAVEENLIATDPNQETNRAELERLKTELTKFQPRRGRPRIGKVSSQKVATYRRVFRALTELSPTPTAAKQMIEGVLGYA